MTPQENLPRKRQVNQALAGGSTIQGRCTHHHPQVCRISPTTAILEVLSKHDDLAEANHHLPVVDMLGQLVRHVPRHQFVDMLEIEPTDSHQEDETSNLRGQAET